MTDSSALVASAPKTAAVDVLFSDASVGGEESAMPVIRVCDLRSCRDPLAQPPTADTPCPHPDAMAVYVAVVRQSRTTSLAQPPPPPPDAATKKDDAPKTPSKSPTSSEPPPPSLNLQTAKEPSEKEKKVEAAKEPTPDKSLPIVDSPKKDVSPINELAKEPVKEVTPPADANKELTSDKSSPKKDVSPPFLDSTKEPAKEPGPPVTKEPAPITDSTKKDAAPITEPPREPANEPAAEIKAVPRADEKPQEPIPREIAKPSDQTASPTPGETKKAMDQTPSLDLQSAKEPSLKELKDEAAVPKESTEKPNLDKLGSPKKAESPSSSESVKDSTKEPSPSLNLLTVKQESKPPLDTVEKSKVTPAEAPKSTTEKTPSLDLQSAKEPAKMDQLHAAHTVPKQKSDSDLWDHSGGKSSPIVSEKAQEPLKEQLVSPSDTKQPPIEEKRGKEAVEVPKPPTVDETKKSGTNIETAKEPGFAKEPIVYIDKTVTGISDAPKEEPPPTVAPKEPVPSLSLQTVKQTLLDQVNRKEEKLAPEKPDLSMKPKSPPISEVATESFKQPAPSFDLQTAKQALSEEKREELPAKIDSTSDLSKIPSKSESSADTQLSPPATKNVFQDQIFVAPKKTSSLGDSTAATSSKVPASPAEPEKKIESAVTTEPAKKTSPTSDVSATVTTSTTTTKTTTTEVTKSSESESSTMPTTTTATATSEPPPSSAQPTPASNKVEPAGEVFAVEFVCDMGQLAEAHHKVQKMVAKEAFAGETKFTAAEIDWLNEIVAEAKPLLIEKPAPIDRPDMPQIRKLKIALPENPGPNDRLPAHILAQELMQRLLNEVFDPTEMNEILISARLPASATPFDGKGATVTTVVSKAEQRRAFKELSDTESFPMVTPSGSTPSKMDAVVVRDTTPSSTAASASSTPLKGRTVVFLTDSEPPASAGESVGKSVVKKIPSEEKISEPPKTEDSMSKTAAELVKAVESKKDREEKPAPKEVVQIKEPEITLKEVDKVPEIAAKDESSSSSKSATDSKPKEKEISPATTSKIIQIDDLEQKEVKKATTKVTTSSKQPTDSDSSSKSDELSKAKKVVDEESSSKKTKDESSKEEKDSSKKTEKSLESETPSYIHDQKLPDQYFYSLIQSLQRIKYPPDHERCLFQEQTSFCSLCGFFSCYHGHGNGESSAVVVDTLTKNRKFFKSA